MRPIFEPGDALFFDPRCSCTRRPPSPSMSNRAVCHRELVLIGAQGFPSDYAPLAM